MKHRYSASRRRFLQSVSIGASAAMGSAVLPVPLWAANNYAGNQTVDYPSVYDLHIGPTPVEINGRRAMAQGINGTVPGPLLRMKEGKQITLNVSNGLDEESSLHWHGLLLPPGMDGVPGISFDGIAPGKSFQYRYTVSQSGTYWYHSHSGLQEQTGVYGPIIIDPADDDPVPYDREFVIFLSDWTFENPEKLYRKLKKRDDYFNYQKRTIADFFSDVKKDGWRMTSADRRMWGSMRMDATDIADVTGAGYTFLMNGKDATSNWTGIFSPGEKVRLRIINGSAMSFFNVRIPGLTMTVVQSDGQNVEPVDTDEFQIGVAETYDVVVQPRANSAYTIFAESMDRSGYVSGTLAPKAGMSAAIPALRKRPLLTMADMGMAHESSTGMSMDHSTMGHDVPPTTQAHESSTGMSMDHSAMGHDMPPTMQANESSTGMSMDHSAMGHDMPPTMQAHEHVRGPGVANVTITPRNRLAHPGIGLGDVKHRALTYDQLRSLVPGNDNREPGRTLELHLTGNMERYMWSFDGIKYSEVDAPIIFKHGERLRMILVNDTMMSHPIHLHGMFVQLVNGNGAHNPMKHTVVVKPAERLAVDLTADPPGDWAFHCHMLFHMKAGMMQAVSVRRNTEDPS